MTEDRKWFAVARCGRGSGADPGIKSRSECRLVSLRCVNGTSGGAWVGVVQAPAGCGEGYGLPMPFYGGSRVYYVEVYVGMNLGSVVISKHLQ